MEIIAHRGFWKAYKERNQKAAFERSFLEKMGTETDFRDYKGKLKISHDVAEEGCVDAEWFFRLYQNTENTLAINVKADGLQNLLKDMLEQYKIKRYFCFDMSIPDTLGYVKAGIRYFVRQSEYESINRLYEKSDGVWMDGFESDEWITKEKICFHLEQQKKVCIVSPELHGREYATVWKRYRIPEFLNTNNVILCTDYPEKARGFFNGQN